ncbi:MAG: DciA family protein [Sideroxydans sp.]|nr:DciA family protein [Sideroxydans sp.]
MSNRLNDFLDADPKLKRLSLAARQLVWLQRQYRSIAPPSLAQGSRVLRFENNHLTLAADNGAVASKLKQLAPQLISLFRTRGCEVTGIQTQVQVNTNPPVEPLPPRAVGEQGRVALDELAHELPEGGLRSAIERLAHSKR